MITINVYTGSDLKEAKLCGVGRKCVCLEMSKNYPFQKVFMNHEDYLKGLVDEHRMYLPVAKTLSEGEESVVFLNRLQ